MPRLRHRAVSAARGLPEVPVHSPRLEAAAAGRRAALGHGAPSQQRSFLSRAAALAPRAGEARVRAHGSRTFASTRAQGINVGSWNTKAKRRPSWPTCPKSPRHHNSRPSDGSMRLAINLSSVLLPQPDGPIKVRNSPSAILRLIGASARVPLAKTFSAESISTAGGRSPPAVIRSVPSLSGSPGTRAFMAAPIVPRF